MSQVTCPECNSPLERYPKHDIPGAVTRYRCQNRHLIGFNVKTGKLVSVITPFEHEKICPEKYCGLPVHIVGDQISELKDGPGIVRLVDYICSKGHQSRRRVIILRKIKEAASN
ncbi:MAG: hypothetical protein ABSE15_00485 [Candidatus Bathyarchaeia archaeon]